MTLIIILNAVFAAFVVVGIVGLHLYAIAKDHSDHARREPVQIAPAQAAVQSPEPVRDRVLADAYRRATAPARA